MKLTQAETAFLLIALQQEFPNNTKALALKERILAEGLSWGCQQARAGSAKTAAKAASSAANGAKGGRPAIPAHCKQLRKDRPGHACMDCDKSYPLVLNVGPRPETLATFMDRCAFPGCKGKLPEDLGSRFCSDGCYQQHLVNA